MQDGTVTDKTRELRRKSLARLHDDIMRACWQAKEEKVPMDVIEQILRGLAGG